MRKFEPMPKYEFGKDFFDAIDNLIITDENIDFFIGVLLTTEDYGLRNQLAMILADTGNPKVAEPLVNLISDPKTAGHRGSLVGALMEYDYLEYLDMLVGIMNENFEVRMNVSMMLRDSKDRLTDEQKKRYVGLIREEIERNDRKAEVLCTLAEELDA